jgi:hypothetical protein
MSNMMPREYIVGQWRCQINVLVGLEVLLQQRAFVLGASLFLLIFVGLLSGGVARV